MRTNTQIEKAKSILNENSLLPNGIDFETRLKLVDFQASNYEYWSHKYTDGTEHYDNSVVSLKFEHSIVEKPFWIVLFKGAQAKINDVCLSAAFWELPNLEDAIYEEKAILGTSNEDGVETILNLVEKFNYLWFKNDEASEDEPIIWNDSDMLSWLADEFENILNIRISLSVPHSQIKEYHIQDLEKALSDAKLAFQNNLLVGGVK